MVLKTAVASSVAGDEAVPQGFKRTEIGLVPTTWETEEIGEIAAIKTGAKNTQDRVDDGAYPFFVRSQKVERINSFSYDTEAVLTAGDGVGTGKVFHYVKGRFDVHQRVYCISNFAPRVNGHYFFYQFSRMFYNRIMSMTAKSSVDSVRMDMISRMRIPLPPVDEQYNIASALSDADALIDSVDRLIAKKQAVKLSTMQRLLTGKQRLPGFENDWPLAELGSALKFLAHGSNPRADLGSTGSVQYLHYGDVHSHDSPILDCDKTTLPFIEETKVEDLPRLCDGDLVMVDASEDLVGIGKSVELQNIKHRALVGGLHTIVARGESNLWAPGFKAYLQFIPEFKRSLERAASGISVYSISKRNVSEISIRLPPTDEQNAIVLVLSDMDNDLSRLRSYGNKIAEVKQGMKQSLLTGHVRLIQQQVNV